MVALAAALGQVALSFTRKAGEAGALFGSVTSIDLAEALAGQKPGNCTLHETCDSYCVVEYNGEQAKIKAMVEAKHVNWDVVEVESGDIGRGCDEGLFEKEGIKVLKFNIIPVKQDMTPLMSAAKALNPDLIAFGEFGEAHFESTVEEMIGVLD